MKKKIKQTSHGKIIFEKLMKNYKKFLMDNKNNNNKDVNSNKYNNGKKNKNKYNGSKKNKK